METIFNGIPQIFEIILFIALAGTSIYEIYKNEKLEKRLKQIEGNIKHIEEYLKKHL